MAAGLLADATAMTAGLVAAGSLAAVAGWLVVRLRGPEPTLRAARRAIARDDLSGALSLLRRIRPADDAPSRPWHAEQRNLEAECLYVAAESALRDRRFADAYDQYQAVAALIGMDEAEAARRVDEAMLAEVRRLSVANPDGPALPAMLSHILERQPCPEALFWLGMFRLRHDNAAAGMAALETAYTLTGGRQVDPALYLGVVALRAGKPRDALRYLADANRLAPNCPLVSYHLGMALIESGGDAPLAFRALQKATVPDGLPKYVRLPQRLWAESLPPGSWVRNVAQRAVVQRTTFTCPLGLDRVEPLLRGRGWHWPRHWTSAAMRTKRWRFLLICSMREMT